VCFTFTACSALGNGDDRKFNSDQLFDDTEPEIKTASLSAPIATNEATDEVIVQGGAPISIEVRQAFLQEDTLHIKLGLSAKTFVETDSVYVGVRGLADGVTVVEEFRLVADESDRKWLDADSKLLVSFNIPAKGLSEYQVFGAWGEDAKGLAKRLSASTSSAALGARAKLSPSLESIQPDVNSVRKKNLVPTDGRPVGLEDVDIESEVDDCPAQPCDIRYRIVARIKNMSKKSAIDSIELAIGLYWASEGQLPQTPQSGSMATANEEVVALKELAISPGESKAIRVRVNRGVPQIPGGRFVPHIRILPK
jgi:hypothetical protein